MGAPKQKWTAEEEAALKAGIDKHGAGKWRTILKDPEFSHILYLRSNVDLKDKWRNMGVTANGWGPRERAKVSCKRNTQVHKHKEDDLSSTPVEEDSDIEPVDVKPISCSYRTLQITNTKKSIPRLDNLILEAITNLKEPAGSSMTAIAMYIEDHYWSPQNFESMLSTKLKMMTASEKLVKVKRKYRIAPTSGFSQQSGSRMLLPEGRQNEFTRVDRCDFITPTKYQIDSEIERMRNMTSLEAAAAAAKAMAEAEAAMAEAEEATREAEIAEADAEAAQAFAKAASLTLKNRSMAGSSF